MFKRCQTKNFESAHLDASVCVMGTPVTSGNRGVLALGTALISLCSELIGGQVILLIGNRDSHAVPFRIGSVVRRIPIVNVRMSPRSRLRDHFFWVVGMSLVYRVVPFSGFRKWIRSWTPWIAAVHDAVLVGDVRGGDSFSDIYGMKRFLTGFALAWSVVLIRGEIVQFPQTYGPFRRPIARFLARFLLLRSSVIIARDRASFAIASELAGPTKDVRLSPDVAFSLIQVKPDTLILNPPLPNQRVPGSVIGVNVNGLMFHGGYTRSNMFGLKVDYPAFLVSVVSSLLAESESEVWLIPHTYAPAGDVESDPEASRIVRDALPETLRSRVRILDSEYDCHELKGIIGLCEFFVGSRMHACIGALSQGVPCVGVAYSMKFRGVFETVQMEDWVVDARVRSTVDAVEDVLHCYRQRNERRDALKRAADAARCRLREVFADLVS